LALDVARAQAQHDSECPDIGPICAVRNEPPQQHHTTLWLTELRLLAEYGLLKNFALQGALPVRIIGTKTVFTDLAGNPIELDYENIHHRNEVLVGARDLQLYAHLAGKFLGLQASVRFGLSLPIGKVQENPYALGALGLPHEHIQFGTGTFDPLFGLDVSKDFGPWSLADFAQTQVPLYEGPKGYQAGARATAGLVVNSGLGLSGTSFRLGFSGYHEWPERWNGEVPTEDGNQGRTDLFLGPGITIPFATDYSVSFDIRARVYGHTVNAQLSLPVLVEVSIGRLFHLESKRTDLEPISSETGAEPADRVDIVTSGELRPLVPVAGKWTVFDFWAPWCEACKPLDAGLQRLAASRTDVAVRRINIVDFDSPIGRRELAGVSELPHVRVIDPQGRLAWELTGTPEEILHRINDSIR
jgi:thiol-disulfide isomerase/thioredoxin